MAIGSLNIPLWRVLREGMLSFLLAGLEQGLILVKMGSRFLFILILSRCSWRVLERWLLLADDCLFFPMSLSISYLSAIRAFCWSKLGAACELSLKLAYKLVLGRISWIGLIGTQGAPTVFLLMSILLLIFSYFYLSVSLILSLIFEGVLGIFCSDLIGCIFNSFDLFNA